MLQHAPDDGMIPGLRAVLLSGIGGSCGDTFPGEVCRDAAERLAAGRLVEDAAHNRRGHRVFDIALFQETARAVYVCGVPLIAIERTIARQEMPAADTRTLGAQRPLFARAVLHLRRVALDVGDQASLRRVL